MMLNTRTTVTLAYSAVTISSMAIVLGIFQAIDAGPALWVVAATAPPGALLCVLAQRMPGQPRQTTA